MPIQAAFLCSSHTPLDERRERLPDTRDQMEQHPTGFFCPHIRIYFQGENNRLGPSLDLSEEIVRASSPSSPSTLASPHGWTTRKRRRRSMSITVDHVRNALKVLVVPLRPRLERGSGTLGCVCEAG